MEYERTYEIFIQVQTQPPSSSSLSWSFVSIQKSCFQFCMLYKLNIHVKCIIRMYTLLFLYFVCACLHLHRYTKMILHALNFERHFPFSHEFYRLIFKKKYRMHNISFLGVHPTRQGKEHVMRYVSSRVHTHFDRINRYFKLGCFLFHTWNIGIEHLS